MSMNGRLETRVILTVPLYLHDANRSVPADLALTENVIAPTVRASSRNAPAVPAKNGNSGNSNGIRHYARVVYCDALSSHNFCVGLELEEPVRNWWDGCDINCRAHAKTTAARPLRWRMS